MSIHEVSLDSILDRQMGSYESPFSSLFFCFNSKLISYLTNTKAFNLYYPKLFPFFFGVYMIERIPISLTFCVSKNQVQDLYSQVLKFFAFVLHNFPPQCYKMKKNLKIENKDVQYEYEKPFLYQKCSGQLMGSRKVFFFFLQFLLVAA